MTPARWRRIEELYEQAQGLEADKQNAFLAEACIGDEELLKELTSLLSQGAGCHGELLGRPLPQVAASLLGNPSQTAVPALPAGKLFGRYRILDRIGHGGLGEVLAAQDTILGRRVALKFLTTENNAHVQILEEARAAASLDHPYVCKVFETGECEGKPFIAMEYLEGETLAQRLKSGSLPVPGALTIAIELAEALAAAHDKGLVHRDVKPSNVMITSSGHVKLMDFGLAIVVRRPVPPYEDETKTMKGQGYAVGTPAYMAPEQVRGERLDARTDVFAFGIVLFEMLSGVHPFRGQTQGATIAAIAHDAPRDIAQYVPAANLPLKRILQRTLAKSPAERYQSARELAFDLVSFRDTGITQPNGALPETIAILPFKDLSPQRDQEYFCDGLAEELIVSLGTVEQLRMVSRSATFRFRGGEVELKEIGRALNASKVLEGSVRKAGERLRIVVNLVNPEDGCPIWSERYDRTLDDIFEIQDDIARAVVEKLRETLGLAGSRPEFRPSPRNVRAYEFYLKGRYFWNKRTEESIRLSIDQFAQALAEDPSYALAHAGIADAWLTLSLYGAVRPLEAVPIAREAANRALGLAPKLTEALTARACIRAVFDWDWHTAALEFEAAIAQNGQSAQTRQWFAMNCLLPRGQFSRARQELKCAADLEPVSLAIATSIGVLDFYRADFDGAIRQFRSVLELDEGFYLAHYFLGQAYSQIQMHQEAIRELDRAFAASGSSESLSALGYARALAGNDSEAIRALEELSGRATTRYVSPMLIAQVQAGLGEFDAAIANIEEAYRMRSADLIWLGIRPSFEKLRLHARVGEILASAGLDNRRANTMPGKS